MGIEQKILVTGRSLRIGAASVLCFVAMLTACGQKGNLYLPNDPEFQQRAKLPDIVRRQIPGGTASQAPVPTASAATSPTTAASAPVGR